MKTDVKVVDVGGRVIGKMKGTKGQALEKELKLLDGKSNRIDYRKLNGG